MPWTGFVEYCLVSFLPSPMNRLPLRSIRRGAAALSLSMAALFGLTTAQAAKNPLNVIEAPSFDGKSGDFKTEPASEGGVTLASIHDGDYAVYKDYDFDSGVAAFRARVSTPRKGSIEIRLDSPTGPLLGICPVADTHGWDSWADVTCNVDNSQAGARDIYLVFHGEGPSGRAVLNLKSFVFLKSVVAATAGTVDLAGRLDREDDEPQATRAWGMPEAGFADDLAHGLEHWKSDGFSAAGDGVLAKAGAPAWAYTPAVYINKTDTGGDWRTLAEAALSVNVVADSAQSRPGVGFASRDGRQAVYVVLNPETGALEAWRKLADGGAALIRSHPKTPQDTRPATDPKAGWTVQPGTKYRLQVDWSPYSDGLIAFLQDAQGKEITSFRTVIDLPAARRPLLVSSGGPARFDHVKFDPTLDGWNFHWEWLKTPALAPDVCNPAVWKHDGKFYMLWRKFGADTFHGVAMSDDGVKWTRVTDQTMKCTGDMNVVVDPFGDGKWYVTPGSANQPWYTSDGADNFKTWTASPLKLGDIFGHSRIQEIVDTRRSPQSQPVSFDGQGIPFHRLHRGLDAPAAAAHGRFAFQHADGLGASQPRCADPAKRTISGARKAAPSARRSCCPTATSSSRRVPARTRVTPARPSRATFRRSPTASNPGSFSRKRCCPTPRCRANTSGTKGRISARRSSTTRTATRYFITAVSTITTWA